MRTNKTTTNTLGTILALVAFAGSAMAADPVGSEKTLSSRLPKADKGITVKAANAGTEIDRIKVFSAEDLSSAWYEDGSPMGMARPRFTPNEQGSVFLAVRASLQVGLQSVKVGTVCVAAGSDKVYQPRAFKIASTNDFSFSYPETWYCPRRWTTIEFQHEAGAPTYDKMLLLKRDKEAPLNLDLVYEVPAMSKELTLSFQK